MASQPDPEDAPRSGTSMQREMTSIIPPPVVVVVGPHGNTREESGSGNGPAPAAPSSGSLTMSPKRRPSASTTDFLEALEIVPAEPTPRDATVSPSEKGLNRHQDGEPVRPDSFASKDAPSTQFQAGAARKKRKVTKFSAESSKDPAPHLWLVSQEEDRPAQVRLFDSVSQLHELVRDWYPQPGSIGDRGDGLSPGTTGVGSPETPVGSGQAYPSVGSKLQEPSPTEPTSTLEFFGPRITPITTSWALSFNWRQGSSDDDDSDGESSASSTVLAPACHWLDVQTQDLQVVESIINMFPIEKDSMHHIEEAANLDSLVVYATGNYVQLNLSSLPLQPPPWSPSASTNGSNRDNAGGDQPEPLHPYRPQHYLPDNDMSVVSIIMFEDWIVTIHAGPFHGLPELLHKLQVTFGRHKRRDLTKSFGATIAAKELAKHHIRMTPAWVCAMMVDFVTEASLPDPSPLLAEADACDEMALLTAAQDQFDMLQRISGLRRQLTSAQNRLYQKERLLRQFLAPDLRTTFVARSTHLAEVYSRSQAQIAGVTERLVSAREVLSQASANLSSTISLQMAQASNEMNGKMKKLSQVASICLPLNIVTGAFGMNVQVPFQTGTVTNLIPFFVICAIMMTYLLGSLPFLFCLKKKTRHDDDGSEEKIQSVNHR